MNSLPPYRASVCLRAHNEIVNLQLIAATTHHPREGNRWPAVAPEVLPQVHFAPEEPAGPRSIWDHLRDLRKAMRVTWWLSRHRPDAVVVHGYDDATRAMTMTWCTFAGIPFYIAADSNIRLDNPRGVIKKAVKSAYVRVVGRMAAGAMPFGSLGAAYFRRYGVPKAAIYRVPAEPDYRLIEQMRDDQVEEARRNANLILGRRRIIFSGRFIEEKRIDLLIEAFHRIAPRRREWDLVLLGDGPLKPRMQQQVSADVAHRHIWLNNISNPAGVFALYRCCDVLALTSEYDAWALVVNEAAASGLALVCSDVVGAAADLVREGVNGRTFRKGDLDDLVAALLDVTDPANLDRYKAASVDVVNEWRRVADPVDGFAAAMRAVGVLRDDR